MILYVQSVQSVHSDLVVHSAYRFVPDVTFDRQTIGTMLSKLIKDKIHEKFGQPVRYPKDCNALADHISTMCKTKISGSTLKRLYGFVRGTQEPRLYTLDIISEYLGFKGWEHLLQSLDKSNSGESMGLEKLKPEQVRKGQNVFLGYEPGKKIEVQKQGSNFVILSSNDRKLLMGDVVTFGIIELHHPLTFTGISRKGESLGKVQVATVSGITSIRKD